MEWRAPQSRVGAAVGALKQLVQASCEAVPHSRHRRSVPSEGRLRCGLHAHRITWRRNTQIRRKVQSTNIISCPHRVNTIVRSRESNFMKCLCEAPIIALHRPRSEGESCSDHSYHIFLQYDVVVKIYRIRRRDIAYQSCPLNSEKWPTCCGLPPAHCQVCTVVPSSRFTSTHWTMMAKGREGGGEVHE